MENNPWEPVAAAFHSTCGRVCTVVAAFLLGSALGGICDRRAFWGAGEVFDAFPAWPFTMLFSTSGAIAYPAIAVFAVLFIRQEQWPWWLCGIVVVLAGWVTWYPR